MAFYISCTCSRFQPKPPACECGHSRYLKVGLTGGAVQPAEHDNCHHNDGNG